MAIAEDNWNLPLVVELPLFRQVVVEEADLRFALSYLPQQPAHLSHIVDIIACTYFASVRRV